MELEQKGQLISLRLTDSELKQVETVAKAQERSRSQVIRRAIRQYVNDETGRDDQRN